MISNSTETSGGLPSMDTSATGPSINAIEAGFPDATGSTSAGHLTYLRQSYLS